MSDSHNYRPNTDDPETSKCMKSSIVILFITLILAIISLVLIITNYNNSTERSINSVDEVMMDLIENSSIYDLIPTKYSVDKEYLLPPSNQAHRGTCWIFATIFLLESQYRANGIRKGFLEQNQYVQLSKQAYGAWLGHRCNENKSIPVCRHGAYGNPENNTEDQLVDSIYYFAQSFPALLDSILPESVCPYYNETDPSTDFKCDGMYEALAQNPISYKIKSIRYATNVNNTKKLLYDAKRPLGIGVPIGSTEYYAPCDTSSYANSSQCQNKETHCPEGYASEFCHHINIESREIDGTFTFINDLNRTGILGGHEMNIVGYNDDWVYLNRFATEKSIANLKGGFILHNSWTSKKGHSVDYLMGRRSEENEAVICPNHAYPLNWIPGDRECLLTCDKDTSKCPSSIKVVRGEGIANIPDLLQCKDAAYCSNKSLYALANFNGTDSFAPNHLFSGLDAINMIEWTDDNQVREFTFDKLPFTALDLAFEPVNLVKNNENDCGYYMFPYDAIAMTERKMWSLLDYWHSSDVEFEFDDSSYLANKVKGKNYTLIEMSTKTWDETPFDGPLPYSYIY